MTAELADCVYALRKRVEDLEEQMSMLADTLCGYVPKPEVTDVRAAMRAAVIAVDEAWKEQYSIKFADDLLAHLNRAGWRFVKTTDETL